MYVLQSANQLCIVSTADLFILNYQQIYQYVKRNGHGKHHHLIDPLLLFIFFRFFGFMRVSAFT
jgi:hypothetical protein